MALKPPPGLKAARTAGTTHIFVPAFDPVKVLKIAQDEKVTVSLLVPTMINMLVNHPAVAECAVIGIPHDEWGEQVHAIVRLHEGTSVTDQQLIDHCKTLIAAFKCPKSIDFREQPLPLSGAGKILKKDLRAPYWEGQDRNVG